MRYLPSMPLHRDPRNSRSCQEKGDDQFGSGNSGEDSKCRTMDVRNPCE